MSGKPVVQGVAVAAIVLAAVAAPAAAQAKLELTPFFGSYYAAMPLSNDLLDDGSNIKVKQIPGAEVGGRLTYWLASGVGFEVAGGYGFSGIRVYDPASQGAGFSLDGTLTTVTGRVLYRLPRSNFHLLGGAGTIIRGGDAWDGLDKLNTITGVAGFGVRAAITPKLALDVKLEGYFYSFKPTDPTTSADAFPTEFQTDFVVAIGVPIALMK
jgi:hypothetical protein